MSNQTNEDSFVDARDSEDVVSFLNRKGLVLDQLSDCRSSARRTDAAAERGFAARFSGRPTEGFWPIAEVLAEEDGVILEPTRRSIAQLDAPEITGDVGVARFIADHARGLIRYNARKASLPTLIMNGCAAFPKNTIAVIVPSPDAADELQRILLDSNIDFNVYVQNVHGDVVRRVVVGSVVKFAANEVEFEKRDILLFPFAQTAIFLKTVHAFLHPDNRFRIFGFLADEDVLGRSEKDFMTGIFGVDEVVVPAQNFVRCPTYFQFTAGCRAPLAPSTSDADLVRAIWQNDERNRMIAKVAQAAREHLAQYGAVSAPIEGDYGASDRVMVLCQSISHALAIETALCGWPIVTGDDIDLSGLSFSQRQRLRSATQCGASLSHAIVTLAGLSKFEANAMRQIILWTGAGPCIPFEIQKLFNVPSSVSTHDSVYGYVIDFHDHSTPKLRQWARQREQEYRRAGFVPRGCRSMTHGRALNYIALRKRERS